MTEYAYAVVSAQGQNIDRQIDAFHSYGVIDKNIYADKKMEPHYKNYKRKHLDFRYAATRYSHKSQYI